MRDSILKDLRDSAELLNLIREDSGLVETICEAASIAIAALKAGNKIMFAGNGGSAADAQHFAGEMVNRFYFDRPPLAAMALSTDTSVITAISNDAGYDFIFARQVRAVGRAGDVFVGISTSGKSPNVIGALRVCREMRIATVGMTGNSGEEMADLCDCRIRIPSGETPRIQEAHAVVGHAVCRLIENAMFGETR